MLLFERCMQPWKKKSLKCVIKPVLKTCAEQLISGVEFEIDTDIKSTPIWILYHFLTCNNLDKFDHKAIWLFSVSYWLIFIPEFMLRPPNISIEPLGFHLSINFIFSQTCISHQGCNLWSSDKSKMDLQVKKLKVHISATRKKNSDTSPYHHPQGRDKLLIPPVEKTYFKMYYFKSIFLKHCQKNALFVKKSF